MTAVPTSLIAHRAPVHDREVPASRSMCLGARNHVPQYPGTHVPGRILGHSLLVAKESQLLSGGAPSNLGRPNAVERLDGTEAEQGQVNNNNNNNAPTRAGPN